MLDRFKFLLFILYFVSTHGFAANLHSVLQNEINKARQEFHLPALSVSLKLPKDKDYQNFVSGTYRMEDTTPINSNTLFQIGSITKTYTAAIIYKLVEKNLLNTDSDITIYLTQYPRWKGIKIKNLLNHTSGLYNYSHGKDFDALLRKFPQKNWRLEELANIAYHHKNQSPPNKKYLYTNTDYLLLGIIIEKITHHNLQTVFNNFFNEYHLSNTYYVAANFSDNLKKKMAHGYNQDGTFPWNTDVTNNSISSANAAGGIISTPEDINIFLQKLFSGKIISEQSLNLMLSQISPTTLHVINNKNFPKPQKYLDKDMAEIGVGQGIGLIYLKGLGYFFTHSGGMPGYESLYLVNISRNQYLSLTYSLKPKNEFIDIKIAVKILRLCKRP